jgi:hypothetical protein
VADTIAELSCLIDHRTNSREPSTSARQAAEALFAPKPQRVEPAILEAAPAVEAIRKPRVLAVAAPAPVPRDEPEAPASVKPPMKPVIPQSQFARIRAWRRYGMTAQQVVEVYGAAVGEIERILRTT